MQRRHSYRAFVLGALAALVLQNGIAGASTTHAAAPEAVATDSAALSADANALITAINTQRTANGLPALSADPQLDALAELRSSDQVTRHYFSHTSPDGSTIFDLLNAAGIPWTAAGENLAESSGVDPVQAAIDGFMHSEEHRANVLSPAYRHLGVAAEAGDGRTIIITVVFTD